MLSGGFKELYNDLKGVIPPKRMLHDSLSAIAFGTDASFYRLLPKLVIKVENEGEAVAVIKNAHKRGIPVTFRGAGTSLAGQSISDSILLIASHGWLGLEVLEGGEKIKLGIGVRGYRANIKLAPYGRKIGPDPASIDSAMIGGIVANNASGMYCGTWENAYKTIADLRIILADGTILDTADPKSVAAFRASHPQIVSGLEEISQKINADEELRAKIIRKHSIKNTTGYGLNSLVDYSDGIDILKHLMVGSEGTLGFISSVTFHTVPDEKHKALSLIIYPNIKIACEAVALMSKLPVKAVELLDRAAIRSVEGYHEIPSVLLGLPEDACVLLVETKAESEAEMFAKSEAITKGIKSIPALCPIVFTDDPKEQAALWRVRKETFPTVAGMRKSGTTPIIEDVCFPVCRLAEAVIDLQKILAKHGYDEAVIFGHALAGNVHFVFNQNFEDPKEVARYDIFMEEIAELVVGKYEGSLKAEHGTGRNMAPFVEKEWGSKGYEFMKEVKTLLDPLGILNPGVIINDDPKAHLKDLKPLPSICETADKCMECGFCEGACVAEGLTLSPRQRVATFRELQALRNSGGEPHRAAEIAKEYQYNALDTCATDSLCAMKCPVKVDTGKLVKELRHQGHSPFSEKVALYLASNMGKVTSAMRGGLNLLYGVRLLLGKKLFGALAKFARVVTFKLIPQWNEHFPKGAHRIDYKNNSTPSKDDSLNVVYFPSCITRSMGVSKSYSKEVEITLLTKMLLEKAGYNIIYPKNLDKLCCGMAFSSKGFVEAGKRASDDLMAALLEASNGGKYPILCDMSPCLYTMHTNMDGKLKLYEPAEFAEKYLLNKLVTNPIEERVAIFAVCSAKKLGVDRTLYNIAKKCAKEVVIIDSNCCGFAGDRGFLLPELNAHGLRFLKEQVYGCDSGYATSRTCEIGLSYHSGIEFKSILYLLNRCSG